MKNWWLLIISQCVCSVTFILMKSLFWGAGSLAAFLPSQSHTHTHWLINDVKSAYTPIQELTSQSGSSSAGIGCSDKFTWWPLLFLSSFLFKFTLSAAPCFTCQKETHLSEDQKPSEKERRRFTAETTQRNREVWCWRGSSEDNGKNKPSKYT